MKIDTKFDNGDEVYFIHDSTIFMRKIEETRLVGNPKYPGILYKTSVTEIREGKCFTNIGELLDELGTFINRKKNL